MNSQCDNKLSGTSFVVLTIKIKSFLILFFNLLLKYAYPNLKKKNNSALI